MFVKIPESSFVKTQWLDLKDGVPVLIQFLEDSGHDFLVHTIKSSDGMWVKVPHNPKFSLMSEEWFKKQYPARTVYRVNVLDVTPHITTSTGGVFSALRKLPERDPNTGEDLRSLPRLPVNEVKLLERGISLFGQINSVIEAMMIESPNMDIKETVFFLQRNGTGRQTTYTFYPRPDITPLPIGEDVQLFDVSMREFTEEEVAALCRGIGFKEILRKAREDNSGEDTELDFSAGLPGLS